MNETRRTNQRERPTVDPRSVADYLVVGAGSAGVVVASRLPAAGARVVLLEAGHWVTGNPAVDDSSGWFALLGEELDWDYQTEPAPGVENMVFHGRVAGRSVAGGPRGTRDD